METVKSIRIENPAVLALVGRIQQKTGQKTATRTAESLIFAGAQASGESITVESSEHQQPSKPAA